MTTKDKNRGAQISADQNPTSPRRKLNKKYMAIPMATANKNHTRVKGFAGATIGGLNITKRKTTSTTENARFISLSPISLAIKYRKNDNGRMRK